MDDANNSICVSCGAPQPRTQPFCGNCGERRLNPEDRRLSAFLARAFVAVSELDSRLLRTLRTLITMPGKLTEDYRDGRRTRYMKPVQLFLLINVVYFFVQPFTMFGGYNTKIWSHIDQQAYSKWFAIESWMLDKAGQLALDMSAFEVVFNSQSELLASTLILLIVPMFALAVAALMLSRKALMIDHSVFALHFTAYYLLVLHCLVALLWYPVVRVLLAVLSQFEQGSNPEWVQAIISLITEFGLGVAVVVPYLYVAFKRVYGVSNLRAFCSAIVGYAALMTASIAYRFVLLVLTLWAI